MFNTSNHHHWLATGSNVGGSIKIRWQKPNPHQKDGTENGELTERVDFLKKIPG